MSNVDLLGLVLIAMIPLSIVAAAVIKALGNRPGYRRRGQKPFDGVERRCPHRKTCEFAGHCKLPPEECPVSKARSQVDTQD